MANFDEYFALYDKGAFDKAYTVLQNIMESQPQHSKDGDLYLWCAELELLVNDDVGRARQLLDKAHDLDCSDLAFYYSISGHVFWRTGEYDRGIQELEKSVELNPNISNLRALGKVLSYDHDRDSISVCRRILEQDPQNCSAHIYLGIEAAKVGDRDRALLMVKQAEKLSPTAHDFFGIGWLYNELEIYNKALSAFLEADSLGYDPKGPLYVALAACYCSMDDYVEAIEYSSRALDISFKDDYAKDVLLRSVEKEGSESILDSLVKKFPDTCLAFIFLAKKAIIEENVSKALEMLTKASQLYLSMAEMRDIGRMYHNLGHYKKALNKYLEVKKLSCDEDKESILNAAIADCYISLGDANAAKKYIQLAVQCDPDDDYVKEIWQEYQKKICE